MLLAILFQRYCFCPTGCLVLLYLHVFSGLSVLFWSGMCNWDWMFPVLHHGAVPLPAAHLLAHNVSTQINVTKPLHMMVLLFILTELNHSSFFSHILLLPFPKVMYYHKTWFSFCYVAIMAPFTLVGLLCATSSLLWLRYLANEPQQWHVVRKMLTIKLFKWEFPQFT